MLPVLFPATRPPLGICKTILLTFSQAFCVHVLNLKVFITESITRSFFKGCMTAFVFFANIEGPAMAPLFMNQSRLRLPGRKEKRDLETGSFCDTLSAVKAI